MAARVLGRDLALAERGVRELPVAGAVADRVDVRHATCGGGRRRAIPVRRSNDTPAASSPSPSTSGARPTATSIRSASTVSPSPKWTVSASPLLLDLRALLAELERDPALAELLAELLARVVVLRRDQPVEHLDDRHLAAERLEDRGELAADDPAAEHDQPARNLGLREQAGRVDAEVGVEPVDRRPDRERARRDDRLLERDVLAAVDRDRVRVLERARALDPLDAVGLEEARDAARHLLDDGGLPLVGVGEVELRLGDRTPSLPERVAAWWRKCAVCTHALVGMQPTRRQVPPSSGSFSMQTTFAPSCAARIAAE